MNEQARPDFRPGRNIALKTPPHEFEATVAFYRDVVGLEELPVSGDSVAFAFGDQRLWVDREPAMSQAEVWLELNCDDQPAAAAWLDAHGIARRDEIEPLPDSLHGMWVASPSNIIHLVCRTGH